MQSFTTNETLQTSSCLEPLTQEKQIPPKTQNYSDHSITCKSGNEASDICISENCQQSDAFVCSTKQCPCQDSHSEKCQLKRLSIITKKLTENDAEVSKINEQKRTILKNLITLLENQVHEEDSELEYKLVRQNVKQNYKLIKSIFTKSEPISSFPPSKASQLYAALIDKKDKPILDEEYIEKIQGFAQFVQKSLENGFKFNPFDNQFLQNQVQLNPRVRRLEQESLSSSRAERLMESSESNFIIERSSSESEKFEEVIQRLELRVETQLNDGPRMGNFLEELRMPAQRMNLREEEEKSQENQSISNDSMRMSELALIPFIPQVPSAIELELSALKSKHNNLLDAIRTIKRRQNYRSEELAKYSPSNSYFHVGPKRECLSIYQALERLNMAEYE